MIGDVADGRERAAPRRRLERDERREQLLRCATKLFAERPYAEVSTADIAAQAGIARGLLNHYFGTKRELYLAVVRRMVSVPDVDPVLMSGPLRRRVDAGVDWFLDAVSAQGDTFTKVTGAGGIGADPEIEAILAEADDAAAERVLHVMGVDPDARARALVRAFGGLAKAAVREWQRDGALSRADVHRLLSSTLLTIVRDVVP